VIAKVEYLDNGETPPFVVTSWGRAQTESRRLYEEFYCACGDRENRIKAPQPALFADRTSTGWMGSNQIRLYFSSIAHCLKQALRRPGTDLSGAASGWPSPLKGFRSIRGCEAGLERWTV
jgi:hypothetical protein